MSSSIHCDKKDIYNCFRLQSYTLSDHMTSSPVLWTADKSLQSTIWRSEWTWQPAGESVELETSAMISVWLSRHFLMKITRYSTVQYSQYSYWKWAFLFRIKKCFPFEAKKRIIQSCLLSVLDYGDVVYMHANLFWLKKLDCIYHAAIWFVTNASSHHCTLYKLFCWSSLYQRRKMHMLLFIAKALLG